MLHTVAPAKFNAYLLKQVLPPRNEDNIDPRRCDLPRKFLADSGRGTRDKGPGPEPFFIKYCFHRAVPSCRLHLLRERSVSRRADARCAASGVRGRSSRRELPLERLWIAQEEFADFPRHRIRKNLFPSVFEPVENRVRRSFWRRLHHLKRSGQVGVDR